MKILTAIALSTLATSAFAGDFTVSFNWNGLTSCTTGRPNTVGNPMFALTNVPEGTKWLYFKLTDYDARGYNHGGGWIAYDGTNTAPANVFQYQSPCPPNGTHTYEWNVKAVTAQNSSGRLLGAASMTRQYP